MTTPPLPVEAREAQQDVCVKPFPVEDYAHTFELLANPPSEAVRKAVLSNNLNIILAALKQAATPSPQSEGEPGRIAELERQLMKIEQDIPESPKIRAWKSELEAELSRLRIRAASTRSA